MQAFRPLTAFQRHLMIALFACAVLVRMAVPEGWMPVTDANGAVRMTICTGMGPVDAGVAAAADHTGMNMHHAGMDHAGTASPGPTHDRNRKSGVEGKSVAGRVDLGGRPIIKQKK